MNVQLNSVGEITATYSEARQNQQLASNYIQPAIGTGLQGNLSNASGSLGCITTTPYYWPNQYYTYHWCACKHEEDAFRRAFKIVKHLIDKNLVKLAKVEDLVTLVDEIAELK